MSKIQTMFGNNEKYSLLPDLLAFCLGLSCAWFFNWSTTELVWSMWLSSLVVGYVTILTSIAGGLLVGRQLTQQADGSRKKLIGVKTIGIGAAIFFVVFFSLHFCGFHAGHATFLNNFFPLEGVDSNDFSSAFTNPFMLWVIVFTKIIPLFGWFLIPVVIAERKALLRPFTNAREMLSANSNVENKDKIKKLKNPMKDAFAGPYQNVIRMHILIFVFAGVSAIGLESFAVFAIVYAAYFFPWRQAVKMRKSVKERSGD